jgi:hypothetical protein
MNLINFYKNSFKVFFLNKKAIDEIHDNHSWITALVAGIILSFTTNVINLVLYSVNIDLFSLISSIISSILLYPFWIFVGVLVIWILLKIFGSKAKYEDLMKFLISMSITPIIIITGLSLLFENISKNSDPIMIYNIFWMISILIIGLWSFYLNIVIYSLLSQINKLKTFLALILIPLFFIFLFIGIINKNIISVLI